ncbi:HD domain-containing phosphohydrolase [Chloroflexota bacterium]
MDTQVSKFKILICDDDPQDRKLIRSYLQMMAERKIATIEAGNSHEIQLAIDNYEIDMVFMDLYMPDKSGVDWLKEIAKKHIAPVVVLTGYGDEEVVWNTLQLGAVGYLPKRKLSAETLASTIDGAIEKWKDLMLLRGDLGQLNKLTNIDSVTGELIRHNFMKTIGKEISYETMEALAMIVEIRDPYTAAHQHRVTQLACAVAKEMAIEENSITGLNLASLIHDIGKMRVPSEILTNPGKLSEAEFEIIKSHPTLGCEVMKKFDLPWPIADIIHQHHEKIDGSGYPLGLSGENILLEARILCVADVVEAIASHRPYRAALGIDIALDEISQGRSSRYDSVAVDTCLTLFRKKKFKFEQRNGDLAPEQYLRASKATSGDKLLNYSRAK